MQEFVKKDGQNLIELRMTWEPAEFGQEKNKSMSCALARPYKKLFGEGKPIGRITHVFFKTDKWPSRILGSFCFTRGKRLLFFPGLIERKLNWCRSDDDFKSYKSTGFIDHITLDKGFQKVHVTILDPDGTKRPLLRSFETKKIKKNTLFWFGLAIQDPSFLEATPEELILTFRSPSQDSKRRSALIMEARERAILNLTTLNGESSNALNKGEFICFDFFIAPSDLFSESRPVPCFVPTQKPIVFGYAPAFKEGTHIRGHPVSLEEITEKIWVVLSKHIGKISDKAILTFS